jgi:hypothetical protein
MGVRAPTVVKQRHGKHASSKIEAVFSVLSVPRSYLEYNWRYSAVPYFNVTSGGIRCSKGTPIIKKSNPSLFIKGVTAKEEKSKSLDIEQIYGHGSQRGSMPGVAMLAGCR